MKIKIIKENFEKAMNEMTKDYSSLGQEGGSSFVDLDIEKLPETTLGMIKFIEDSVEHLAAMQAERQAMASTGGGIPVDAEDFLKSGPLQRILKDLGELRADHTPGDVSGYGEPGEEEATGQKYPKGQVSRLHPDRR